MYQVKICIRNKYFPMNKYVLNIYYIPNTILDTEFQQEQNWQKFRSEFISHYLPVSLL